MKTEAIERDLMAPDAPPSTPDFSGKVGLNLAVGLITSYCSHPTACWRTGCCCWCEGPWALVIPEKAIRFGEGFYTGTMKVS